MALSTVRAGRRRLEEVGNLDGVSGFAVAEQLGRSLGGPQVVDLVFPVLQAKQTDQLLLKEYLLEMAPNAILRGS